MDQYQYCLCKNSYYYNVDLDTRLAYACYTGNVPAVLQMIQEGATDFNRGLHEACERGYYDLILLMIEHGAMTGI